MTIPARSIPTRVGEESLSTAPSTELDTHGREAAVRDPTLIREDRTQPGKCCVSSSSIRSHSSLVRVSPFVAPLCRLGRCSKSTDLCDLRLQFETGGGQAQIASGPPDREESDYPIYGARISLRCRPRGD